MKKVKGLVSLMDGNLNIHKFKNTNGILYFLPIFSNNNIKIFFYFLFLLFLILGLYVAVVDVVFDGILILLFSILFFIVARRDFEIYSVEINNKTKIIKKYSNVKKIEINFNDINCIQVIKKLKSSGNGYVTQICELNIKKNNQKCINLVNSSNVDIILEQAKNISKMVNCNIEYDDENKYK